MKNKYILKLIEYLIFILIWLIGLTCKKRFSGALPDAPCVLLFWHDKLAFMPFIYSHLRPKMPRKDAYVIISDHKDGELITRVVSHFGIKAVRGSSYKNAVRALVGALSVLKKGGDLVITPDGPRGPRHSISDGCVTIPQKSGAKIAILSYNSSKSWFFKSWDKMELPKPFSTLNYTISEPFSVENLELETAKELIAKKFTE